MLSEYKSDEDQYYMIFLRGIKKMNKQKQTLRHRVHFGGPCREGKDRVCFSVWNKLEGNQLYGGKWKLDLG